MQFYEEDEFSTLCRACSKSFVEDCIDSSTTKHNIFLTPDLPRKFIMCTSLICEPTDGLPKYLCDCCYHKLNDFHKFQAMCTESAQRFGTIRASSLKAIPFADGKQEFDLETMIKLEEVTISESDGLYQSDVVGSENNDVLLNKDQLKDDVKLQKVKVRRRGSGRPAKGRKTCDIASKKVQIDDSLANNHRKERSKCKEASPAADDSPSKDAETIVDDNPSKQAETSETLFNPIDTVFGNECIFDANDDEDVDFTVAKTHKKRRSENVRPRVRKRKLHGKDNSDELQESITAKSSIFQCDVCPKRFFVEHRLIAHKRSHDGLVPYPCPRDGCDKGFKRWHRLSEHLKHHEGTNKWFTCEEVGCARVYKYKATLVMHLRKYHKLGPELKSHICEICGKVFKGLAQLKEHRYTHKDQSDLPFACEQPDCNRRFLNKDKLKIHLLRHAGIKNFVCPHCGTRKTTRNELKVHINYHTLERTWPCRFCSHVSNNVGNLKRHVRTVHEGVKNYACSYCDRTFAKSETRKHHEMIHTGEKPHECQECGKRFIQLVALRTHQKVHQRQRRKTTTCLKIPLETKKADA